MVHKFPAGKKKFLESASRKRIFNPKRILEFLGIQSGMTVADIGCGTGLMTVPISSAAGPDGKIYAVDISAGMIREVIKKIESKKLSNVRAVLSRENEIPIESAILDYVILVAVVHELKNRHLFFRELRRILKDNAIIGIIEWKKVDSPYGPPVSERISLFSMKKFLANHGFTVRKTGNPGKYIYGIIAVKNPRKR